MIRLMLLNDLVNQIRCYAGLLNNFYKLIHQLTPFRLFGLLCEYRAYRRASSTSSHSFTGSPVFGFHTYMKISF